MNTTTVSEKKGLLTKEQMAIKFCVSTPTINNWMRKGILDPIKIGGRVYFRDIDRMDLAQTKTK